VSPTDDLVPILKKLRLSGVLQTLHLRHQQAVDDDLTHSEFLYRLLKDEVERREAKQLGLRLKRASFEHAKTVEDFDFHFNPRIPKTKVIDLATCCLSPASAPKSIPPRTTGGRPGIRSRAVSHVRVSLGRADGREARAS